ncbi:MAG: hypothetical protein K9G58_00490 [Bacteroidales bacterium]|nr:hypothetical protein [Bacteroidales bacterium]MCF8396617.1 hypothetical protein [Bacteroidales bacterium]
MQDRIDKHIIISAIAILGFSNILTQILVLREFLSVLSGNELVIGILLSNWMLITGLGAYLGRFTRRSFQKSRIIILQIAFAFLPLLTVFILNTSRFNLFTPGIELNILQILLLSFIILLPFCIISGILFNLFAAYQEEFQNRAAVSRTYAIESFGSFTGGLFSAFIMIYYVDLYTGLIFIMMINLMIMIIFAFFISMKSGLAVLSTSAILVLVTLYFIPVDLNKHKLFSSQEIIENRESVFGQVTVTRSGDQLNYYENGVLLYNTSDIAGTEEIVHFAFSQHPAPKKVLVFSGNFVALMRQIKKYPDAEVDFIEMNPVQFEQQKKFHNEADSMVYENVSLILEDPVLYLRTSQKKYDLIIMNMPGPSSAMINRYYTKSFFKRVHDHLSEHGVFAFYLPPVENYLSDQLLALISSIVNTLKMEFQHIDIVSSKRIYLLASANSLSANILDTLEKRNIENEFVNGHYFKEDLVRMRSEMIREKLLDEAPLNKNFRPIAYYYQIRHWLHQFDISMDYIFALMIAMIILVLILIKPINFGLFTGGFTASALEFLIILSFQVIYGYLYQFVGLIIAVFMLGLYFGSSKLTKLFKPRGQREFLIIHACIGISALLIPLLLKSLDDKMFNQYIIQGIILLLTILIGSLTGLQYASACSLFDQKANRIAASTYFSDMAGSAFGILIASVLLVPLFGIMKSGVILLVFNAFSILNIMIRSKVTQLKS